MTKNARFTNRRSTRPSGQDRSSSQGWPTSQSRPTGAPENDGATAARPESDVPAAGSPDAEEADLLALWEQAWALARRCCAGSLRRLQAGDGGFYEADDLQQDLFIEFWALARDWQASGEDEAALWAAWRRRLWGQGCHILRRRPQRLWDRAEYPVAPDRLALDASDDEPAAVEGLPTAARQALTAGEDAAATHDQLADLSRLEDALWALRPTQRQILYMVTLAGLPAAAVERLLGLGSRTALYQRLFVARQALRRGLAKTHEEE